MDKKHIQSWINLYSAVLESWEVDGKLIHDHVRKFHGMTYNQIRHLLCNISMRDLHERLNRLKNQLSRM